ncbi:hypothetical protein [Xylella taiwanensis]|uniref:Uncharacterized protein n=1 Tax=Xylella taiwanensis TaxID=1444770 RepID=Z9JKP8_9GAMM|nr:hypothetical protein [Xylella taiwanensis]EWS78342.1 hypothetical protein AF72_06175 [Xylella taiwanensis]
MTRTRLFCIALLMMIVTVCAVRATPAPFDVVARFKALYTHEWN